MDADIRILSSDQRARGHGDVARIVLLDVDFRLHEFFNRSLRHEYVHHVLITNGIDEPMWFQEGTALLNAGELSWFKWHPTGRMLPTREMVHHFPQAASPEFTEAFYGQAFRMVTFLNDLCWRRGDCAFARDLVSALKNGRATPDTLFDWAVAQRGTDLFATARLPLWDDYVENGFRFSAATESARLSRYFKPR